MKHPLIVLDDCARGTRFTALDNFDSCYRAACRLSLYRGTDDWAIVIESFVSFTQIDGPSLIVETYGNNLYQRNSISDYVTPEAHTNYLANNPHREFRPFYPVEDDAWIDAEDREYVASQASHALLRGTPVELPNADQLLAVGIVPASGRIAVFEAARYWAHEYREQVLGTTDERRVSVQPEMKLLLELDEWEHPDVLGGRLPSDTDCFRGICDAAMKNDPSVYSPAEAPNTHWSNWPYWDLEL